NPCSGGRAVGSRCRGPCASWLLASGPTSQRGLGEPLCPTAVCEGLPARAIRFPLRKACFPEQAGPTLFGNVLVFSEGEWGGEAHLVSHRQRSRGQYDRREDQCKEGA